MLVQKGDDRIMGDAKATNGQYKQLVEQLVDVDKLNNSCDGTVNRIVDGELTMVDGELNMNEETENVLSGARDDINNLFSHNEVVDTMIDALKNYNKDDEEISAFLALTKSIAIKEHGSIEATISALEKQATISANLYRYFKACEEAGIFS